jgi:hypothetical protein
MIPPTHPTVSPEPISFVTAEEGTDLIVSFVVDLGAPGRVASIILLRTPVYERLLPEDERGVHVSHEQHPEREDDLLDRVRLTPDRVEIETVRYRYVLDVSRVDSAELEDAHKVLRQMNFDGGFALEVADVRW